MKVFNEICISLLFYCIIIVNANCPAKKESRELQKRRLRNLTDQDIIVELILKSKNDMNYKFHVETVWHKQNGGLQRGDKIYVDPARSNYRECLEEMTKKRTFIMMLSREEENVYLQKEPPVSEDKENHRNLVLKRVCLTLNDGVSCKLRVTADKPTQKVFIGSIVLFKCKVDSTSAVETQWFKDNKNVENEMYKKSGVRTIHSNHYSAIFIAAINTLHVGDYECRVTTEDGQIGRATSRVQVRGVDEPGDTKCRFHNCMNGGTCQRNDGTDIERCACPAGYNGDRCQITMVGASQKAKIQEMDTAIRHLSIGVTVAVGLLVCVLLVASIYVVKLRRKIKKNPYKLGEKSALHSEAYEVVVHSCSDEEMPVTTNSVNETRNTSVQLSVKDSPNQQSYRASDVAFSRSSNDLEFSTTKANRLSPFPFVGDEAGEKNSRSSSFLSTTSRNSTDSDKSLKRSRLNANSFS